jgi:F0F1-type ATP synthase assembly protein I
VKLLATIGLMAIAAVYVVWLVWPAMIAGIVLAANAPWLVPMLIRQKAGNGR